MHPQRIYRIGDFFQPSDDEPIRSVITASPEAVIVAWHVQPGQRIAAHIHPSGQDTWTILAGQGDYQLDASGATRPIHAGDVVLAHTGCVHGSTTAAQSRCSLCLSFHRRALVTSWPPPLPRQGCEPRGVHGVTLAPRVTPLVNPPCVSMQAYRAPSGRVLVEGVVKAARDVGDIGVAPSQPASAMPAAHPIMVIGHRARPAAHPTGELPHDPADTHRHR